MKKIVINACFGGFGISEEALAEYNKRANAKVDWARNICRDDPLLVAVVEEMEDRASDAFSNLKVIEIPDGVDWQIEEYDGFEHVAEAHRTWP